VSSFVDTSAFLAVLVANDVNHRDAERIWQRELGEGQDLLTSNYILVETTAVLQHRVGMGAVRSFVQDVIPALRVEWVSQEDHRAATAALLAAGRRNISFVDCSSFEVMRRLGLERAFAFDRHFADAGFKLVD
jgi:predicted nucleic acid-binding protein